MNTQVEEDFRETPLAHRAFHPDGIGTFSNRPSTGGEAVTPLRPRPSPPRHGASPATTERHAPICHLIAESLAKGVTLV